MKLTQKLNWKSVWLVNCLSACWRTIKIQSKKDSISVADKMNSDISLLGDLWFWLLLVLEGSVSAATVWLSFLSFSLCNASTRISIRLLGECQQDASQGGDTWGEREQRQEAERWGEKGLGCVIHQSSNIGEMQVLNGRSFIYRFMPNLVLLPLSLQVLDI